MGASASISTGGSPLVLAADGHSAADGLFVQTITRPTRQWRRTRATSDSLHGAPQTSAVLEVTEVALTVAARAASAAALDAYRMELEDAVFQWAFTLTVVEDGVTTVYSCDCADITWNAYTAGMADGLISTATLTIPCHPIPGA